VDGQGPLARAIDARVPSRLVGPDRKAYFAALTGRLRARGWWDRAFYYLFDEPERAD
jgi:hypothetical protein